MTRIFRLLALIAVSTLLVGAATPAVAQSADTAANQSASPPQNATTAEQIDENTRLVRASYDGDTGTATVVLDSDEHQSVLVYDAGYFAAGKQGEPPSRSVALDPDEPTEVRIPASKTDDGYVGIGVSTDETPIYAKVIEPGGDALDVMARVSTLQAWFGGVVIALTWIVLAALYKLRKEGAEPRRATY